MVTATAIKLPSLLYGTAWKRDATKDLVTRALLSGFRGIDTAAQPKHYQEHLVGAGIRQALHESPSLQREDLYIQTKFTSVHGQDVAAGVPYDPNDSIANQVRSSVASSLLNLRPAEREGGEEPYVDCLVLHSPFPTTAQTMQAWRAMEAHVPDRVRTLGLSNCYDLQTFQALYDSASVKPSILQNRFHRESSYDRGLRAFCRSKGIIYQSFWTLTANPHLLRSQPVAMLRDHASVLCGTTNASRMRANLDGVAAVETWKSQHEEEWHQLMSTFDELLKECFPVVQASFSRLRSITVKQRKDVPPHVPTFVSSAL